VSRLERLGLARLAEAQEHPYASLDEETVDLPPEVKKKLQALGYLD